MTASDAAKKTTEAARRTWRTIAAHPVTVSFWLVVVVAFAVVSALAYSINSTRDLSRSNKAAITKVARLQREQTRERNARTKLRDEEAARAKASDLRLCTEIEALKTVIRGVVDEPRAKLLQSPYFQQHPEQVEAALRSGAATAAKFAPKNCRKLPSVAKPKPAKK